MVIRNSDDESGDEKRLGVAREGDDQDKPVQCGGM